MAMTENADLYATAASLQSRRRSAEAERLYRRLVQQAHASEPEYEEWMRGLVETYRSMGRLQARTYEQALCCFNLGIALRRIGERGAPSERPGDGARTGGDRPGGDREGGGARQAAHRQFARAQQFLEEASDEFEARGERE